MVTKTKRIFLFALECFLLVSFAREGAADAFAEYDVLFRECMDHPREKRRTEFTDSLSEFGAKKFPSVEPQLKIYNDILERELECVQWIATRYKDDTEVLVITVYMAYIALNYFLLLLKQYANQTYIPNVNLGPYEESEWVDVEFEEFDKLDELDELDDTNQEEPIQEEPRELKKEVLLKIDTPENTEFGQTILIASLYVGHFGFSFPYEHVFEKIEDKRIQIIGASYSIKERILVPDGSNTETTKKKEELTRVENAMGAFNALLRQNKDKEIVMTQKIMYHINEFIAYFLPDEKRDLPNKEHPFLTYEDNKNLMQDIWRLMDVETKVYGSKIGKVLKTLHSNYKSISSRSSGAETSASSSGTKK